VGFRTIAIKPEIHAQGEINVTPLIDVVLVLLIIFMVVTPLAEKQLSVFLPAEKRTARSADVAPTQLAVHVADGGGLAINDRAVPRTGYVAQLRALLEDRAPAQRVVFVIASDGVSYPKLVEVMDGAKQAGALTVGLAIEASP
jgi:biopolymer transport protein ExbD